MGWFGRLTGKSPPRIPAGGRLFLDRKGIGDKAVPILRLQMPGQDQDTTCAQFGPTFTNEAKANEYRDWCEGGPTFSYGTGAV